jgi:PHD/YefM family antitoxin component YafN of YafNO toxin-antitoxin module
VGLTAEEYNRMSVSETRHKYKTDAGFAKAVDKLIAEGKI